MRIVKYTDLIGFLVSETIHDLIRLQSLLRGLKKGALIREIIREHAMANRWSVEDMTERYAKHLYSQWDMREKHTHSFGEYMLKVRKDLTAKEKLPKRLIEPILTQCKELHENNL